MAAAPSPGASPRRWPPRTCPTLPARPSTEAAHEDPHPRRRGHAAVLAEALRLGKTRVAGFTDPSPSLRGKSIEGLKVLGDDSVLTRLKPSAVRLVNGLGAAGDTAPRRRLYETWRARGFRFPAVAARSAEVARSAGLGEGCQVLTRAVVHPRAVIGENAVINTGAIVEHDAVVGAHAFVSPGAVVCGGARLGEGSFIGAGAVVLPGVSVGAGARLGAGAVATRDVPPGATAVGVPAKES
ncbi:MAG: acetyltransferase [Elusimicrobiota bacterium]|nr:MAG: acetyltransferase [Elusimicrobiota bacterium]